MKNGRNTAQRVLTNLDFPGEILTGVPVVEIKGRAEAVVINHRGVIGYEENAVLISSSVGAVKVIGTGLHIFRMNRERIQLHGTICRVEIGDQT